MDEKVPKFNEEMKEGYYNLSEIEILFYIKLIS